MDRVASSIILPCKYSTFGCKVSLLYTQRRKHEGTCEFRPYSCPLKEFSCNWEGSLKKVLPHLTEFHKILELSSFEYFEIIIPDIEDARPGYSSYVISYYEEHFFVVIVKRPKCYGHQHFFATVQMIGTREQAEDFVYRIDINGPRGYVGWQARTRSIREGVFSAITNSDCLVFAAEHFVQNGKLTISVTTCMF
jgi:E3 ubiquitin-protein ligase SIAH1